jgi:hypothetical protein
LVATTEESLNMVAAASQGAFMRQLIPGRLGPPPLGAARAAEERMPVGAGDPPAMEGPLATAAHSLIVVERAPVTEGRLLVMEERTLDAAALPPDMQEEHPRVVAQEAPPATAGLLLAIPPHTVGGEERQRVTAPLPAMEGQPWVAVPEPPAAAGRPLVMAE